MGLVLLERENQMAELTAARQKAILGEGCMALVSGEAGIGKTSLVETFVRSQADSLHTYWGSCDALITPHPLSPLYDVAAQIQGELFDLLHSNANRQAIFTAFLRELQIYPSIVIFEDVHWSDEATLDLIKFLGRRISRTKSLLILTYREDEIGPKHPLRLVFGELPRTATLRLPLLPLSKEAVTELARVARQDDRIYDLFTITGGNPFFVTEVLANNGVVIPPTVRDAVLARAARLSPKAHDVLITASVVPRRIEKWLLDAVLSPQPAAIEECVESGVLIAEENFLAFRHELARRAIEESLSPLRKQSIHQDVLNVLVNRGVEHIQYARLVHHAKNANDGEAVLHFAPEAARQAAKVGAHLEAAALYETALQYSAPLTASEKAKLFENRAYECYVTSQVQEAIQARTAALELWQQNHCPLQEGNNLRWLSRLHWFLGQQSPAVEFADKALQLLETLPPGSELAMAYSNRAQLHMLANETSEAVHWGKLAIELAEQIGDAETLSHALNNVGSAEILAGRVEAGRALLEKSLKLAQTHELHEHIARAYTNLGSELVIMRDYDTAAHYLDAGITFSIERDLDSWSLYMLTWRARANFEQGRWIEASDDIVAVLSNLRSTSIVRIPALATLGRLRARRGDPGIYTALDEAYELAMSTGEIQRIGPVVAARAEAAYWQGKLEQVEQELQAAYELATKNHGLREQGELAFWVWRSGRSIVPPESHAAKPYTLQITGDWHSAALLWEKIGCPFERALALADGDVPAQHTALAIFRALGAQPAVAFIESKLATRSVARQVKEKYQGLSARERETAALIAQGKSNREIAEIMSIGVKTAETYVTRILNKLGFDSRVQIATWAIEIGLSTPPDSTH